MNVLSVGLSKFNVPAAWGELSQAQCTRVLSVLLMHKWNDLTRLILLETLLPAGFKKYFDQLSDDQVIQLLDLTDWLNVDPAKIPLARFRVGIRWYYVPQLSNLNSIEAALVDNLLQKWANDGQEKDLNKVVGILCRPAKWWISIFPWAIKYNTKWNGDKRQRFNGNLSDVHVQKMQKVSIENRLAVVWSYLHLKRQVMKAFGNLFEGSSGSGSFLDCIYQVSEKNVFGTFEETCRTPFLNLLGYLKSNANANQHKPNSN
jgi:hypothetical protein